MADRLIACEHCDYLHIEEPLPKGGVAKCARCGSPLYKAERRDVDMPLAFAITALVLLVIANIYPILTFEMEGRSESNTLISGVFTFWNEGFPFLSFMVALTSVLAPSLLILSQIYVLVAVRFNRRWPGLRQIWHLLSMVRPWSMLDVFLIGLLVALTKLTDFADVIAGPAFYAVCCLIPVSLLMNVTLDPRQIWRVVEPVKEPDNSKIRATILHQHQLAGKQPMGDKDTDWITCESCGLVVVAGDDGHCPSHCPRCRARLHHRKPQSLSRAWALLIAAAILYIPANLLPIMTVTYLGQAQADTILSGVSALIEAKQWPIAIVVFVASIMVPILKIVLLAWVYGSTTFGRTKKLRERTLIYRITELIGRWSMIDVFMVSILAALVKLGNIATVAPGFGAVAFCSVVILTMLSAMAFDPRLIWDRAGMQKEQGI